MSYNIMVDDEDNLFIPFLKNDVLLGCFNTKIEDGIVDELNSRVMATEMVVQELARSGQAAGGIRTET